MYVIIASIFQYIQLGLQLTKVGLKIVYTFLLVSDTSFCIVETLQQSSILIYLLIIMY